MKPLSFGEKIHRFKSFYQMDLSDGPIIGFFLGTYYPLNRYSGSSSIPDGLVSPRDINVDTFRSDYTRLKDEHDGTAGETIWSGSAFWGLPWMEMLCGCAIQADHSTGSMRSIHPALPPRPEDISPFDENNPLIQKAGEFLSILTSGEFSFPLGTTLMRGFSDILSALYGTPEFVYRLVDGGTEINDIIGKIADLWIRFGQFQLDRIPDFHGGTGSYFYNMWMPGKGVWIQEDASALLSPTLFRAHILPALLRVIESFDSVIIHLHPAGYIPIEPLIESNLIAIELHIDKGGPTAEELLPQYRAIQAKKPLVIWGDLSREDLQFIKNNLDLSALTVLPVIDSPEQAAEILTLMRK